MRFRAPWRVELNLLAALALALAAACTSSPAVAGSASSTASAASPTPSSSPDARLSLTLYASADRNAVDAVVAGYEATHPGATVTVLHATIGDLDARLAADQAAGGVRADAIWGADPLSMQAYATQQLLRSHPIALPAHIPAKYTTDALYPAYLLHLVIVARKGLSPQPEGWSDLTRSIYRGRVAIPDPAASGAGPALAAVGYLANAPDLGFGFYRALRANGAAQVPTVPDVISGVAQGRYSLGIALDSQVRSAQAAGSAVRIIWPESGAVTLYSPIAVTAASKHSDAAAAFLRYVLSADAQRRIGAADQQPVMPGVPGPAVPAGADRVTADWTGVFGHRHDLIGQYQSIFG